MLQDLLNDAPRSEPLVRIYKNYICFNAVAVKLLGLKEGDSVSIMRDDRDGYLYVANCNSMKQSHAITMKKTMFTVSSAPLCRKMAENLEGFGSYKICKDETQDYMGHKFYNIFKKKYGKD